MSPKVDRCDWCGFPAGVIWVHGHGQCARCGVNIEPCCQGGYCETRPHTNSKADHA